MTEKIKLKTAKTVAVASRNLEVGRPEQIEDLARGSELRARFRGGWWECWGAGLARETLGRGKRGVRLLKKKKKTRYPIIFEFWVSNNIFSISMPQILHGIYLYF